MPELIPISLVAHQAFCPRRAGLEAMGKRPTPTRWRSARKLTRQPTTRPGHALAATGQST